MSRLSPANLYRLKILAAAGPRFYNDSLAIRRLEMLGLILSTGRTRSVPKRGEYRITDAGLAELARRYDVKPHD